MHRVRTLVYTTYMVRIAGTLEKTLEKVSQILVSRNMGATAESPTLLQSLWGPQDGGPSSLQLFSVTRCHPRSHPLCYLDSATASRNATRASLDLGCIVPRIDGGIRVSRNTVLSSLTLVLTHSCNPRELGQLRTPQMRSPLLKPCGTA